MFLINENMTANEIKKEIDEILKPIKLFCKRWRVQFQYADNVILAEPVIERIDELIELLKQHDDDDDLKARAEKFSKLKQDLDVLAISLGQLSSLEIELIYKVLFANTMQAELVGDTQMWAKFNVENVSPPKINALYQEACSSLLEMIKYNRIRNGSYRCLINFI